MFSHPGIYGHSHNNINIWGAYIYEYRKDDDPTYHPHIIMLSYQSTYGQDGSILYNKLIQLITAMRNRAHKRVMIEEGLEKWEDPKPCNPHEFYFKHEQRFLVLMVSCVRPQHARIYHACMDGMEVVIRQSKLFSFEKGENAPCDYFARILASRRLEEDDKY